jgi:MYXO-CTERM domain-containing protein
MCVHLSCSCRHADAHKRHVLLLLLLLLLLLRFVIPAAAVGPEP